MDDVKHHTHPEFCKAIRKDVGEGGSMFSAHNASTQLGEMVCVLRAAALIDAVAYGKGWKDVPPNNHITLTNAVEYLKCVVDAMVQESPWLIGYLLSYSVQYFHANG